MEPNPDLGFTFWTWLSTGSPQILHGSDTQSHAQAPTVEGVTISPGFSIGKEAQFPPTQATFSSKSLAILKSSPALKTFNLMNH